MSSIFISYASEDRERARILAQALEQRGWPVWWDREIPLGKAFDEVIEENLARAQCVLVLWSKASVGSRWVRAEASAAARSLGDSIGYRTQHGFDVRSQRLILRMRRVAVPVGQVGCVQQAKLKRNLGVLLEQDGNQYAASGGSGRLCAYPARPDRGLTP